MKLVSNMGFVYRLSDKAFRRILRKMANDENFDLDKDGTLVGYIHTDITDLSADEAKDLLDQEREEYKRKRTSQTPTPSV